MAKKRKQQIIMDSLSSLESLIQETYNDACIQINDSLKIVNELKNKEDDDHDVDDVTKLAKSKTDALKVKDSAIRLKLEIAKLQNDFIKKNHNSDDGVTNRPTSLPSEKDFKDIREILKERAKTKNNDTSEDETEE
jgi:hypothetical protein